MSESEIGSRLPIINTKITSQYKNQETRLGLLVYLILSGGTDLKCR